MQIAIYWPVCQARRMTDYPRPILTVDIVVIAFDGAALQVGTLRREQPPFQGLSSLPGGYVHTDKDLNTEAAARRVLADKTGLTGLFCQQLATFSGPARDPRDWSASVAYYALIPADVFPDQRIRASLTWTPPEALQPLAFDHRLIVDAAFNRIRAQARYSSLPAWLLGETFTLAELRHCYELLLDAPLNDSAFRRKISDLDFLEPVPGARSKATARPAQLYRQKTRSYALFDRAF